MHYIYINIYTWFISNSFTTFFSNLLRLVPPFVFPSIQQPVATMALVRLGKCYRFFLLDFSKAASCGFVQPAWIVSCVGGKTSKIIRDVSCLIDICIGKCLRLQIVSNPHGNYTFDNSNFDMCSDKLIDVNKIVSSS